MTSASAAGVPEEPRDAELVARALAHDQNALEALARRHYGPVFAIAYSLLGNRPDAEDNCHDAFVTAFSRLPECRHPERFGQWVGAIARNLARNQLVSYTTRQAEALTANTPAAAPSQDGRVERSDLRQVLEAALATLSPVEREVVLLHDLYEWRHEAIADSIGTSVGMSRQHLFKARRRLRAQLGADLLKEHFDV